MVVGYTRVSSQEQAIEGNSLDAQRGRITAWAAATAADLVDVIEDAGVSGSQPLHRRSGGQRVAAMMAQRQPDVDSIVVTRLDRLGRNAAETLTHLHRFAEGKLGLVSISDSLDLTSPQGRAMAGVAAVFGQLERELIGQRTAEALQDLKKQGRVYGPIPFGFTAKRGRLVEKTDEQQVLRRIQAMRGRGRSYRSIADRLNAQAIPAKRGGAWSPMSVRSVRLTSAQLSSGKKVDSVGGF